ncbi:MAG: SprB repeat-containing protein, partial [Flavobacterium sp.]|nr:SprB repeat-containing protein [Pedobacter sp.]
MRKVWAALQFLCIAFFLLTAGQHELKAQCNNAITSGNFSSIPPGQYTSIGSYTSAIASDFISIVNNNGSVGAHIKRTLNYSLKQTIYNLKSATPYTLSFDYSLLDNCHASAQTSFRVEVFNGATSIGITDINATNGGGASTGVVNFTTPPVTGVISIVFTDPNSNKPSCGAVIDNLFILSPFEVTSAHTNVSCFNQSNGSFTISGTGGAGAYSGTYSFNGNPLVSFTVSNGSGTVNNLAAGSYEVTLRDANGCPQVKTIVITQPTALTITGTKTDVTCAGFNNGTINLNISGGTAPFNYMWNDGATTQNVTNLSTGPHSVTVTDAKGCSANYSVNIFQPTAVTVLSSFSNPTCFGSADGSINLSVSGGTAPYSYSWSNGSTLKNQTGLAAASYTVTVTDARGCTNIQNITLTSPPAMLLSTSVINVLCSGNNSGSIDLIVSGGTAPYSYNWSNGSTVQDLTNLIAGTYSVTVTDNKNCTSVLTVAISQPSPVTINYALTNVSCAGNNNGSILLTPTGGTGTYSYLWNTGATTNNLSGLASGSYSVTVSDQNGCTAVTTISISQPIAISLSATQTNIKCFGSSTGAINLTVSGGTAPFSYLWNNISTGYSSTTEDISSLPAGTYAVTVTDLNGCTSSISVTLTQIPAITLSSTVTNVSCFGNNTGAINLSVSGGQSPYAYVWTNTSSTSQDLSNLLAGNYTVTVTDANGCIAILPHTVTQPAAALNISGTKTNVLCFGSNTGSVNITPSGGTAPYTYSWSNGRYTQDITNLLAGSYTVTVTDAKGCVKTKTYTITQPAQILLTFSSTNPICVGSNNGSITINTPTGGSAPYSYSWVKDGVGISSPDLNALTAGVYQLTVTDQNGCSVIHSIVLNDPVPILIDVRQIDIICEGSDPAASISIDISGGTAPYTKVYTNIDATTSLLTVTDFFGCEKTIVVPYSVIPAITINAEHEDVKCYGDNTGSISISVSGGNAPYTYVWSDDPSLNVSNRNNLFSGTYTINIVDNSGCELRSLIVNIIQPPAPLIITQTAFQNITCPEGSDGSISVDVTGGTSNYTYLWSNGASTKNISNLLAGSYTLTVTDAFLCQKSFTFEITAPEPIIITSTTNNIDCFNGNDGSINLSVVGGSGMYTYTWQDLPSGPYNLSTRSGLKAGIYNITITDQSGCKAYQSITLIEPPALTLSSSKQDVDCFGDASGSATIEIVGGTAPYTYNGSAVTGDIILSNLAAGTFSITVRDANGCEAIININISQPVKAMDFTAVVTNVKCSGDSNGSINVNGNGGTAPYTYSWSNGSTTPNLNSMPAGTYSVVITDLKGCLFSINNIIITQPTLPLTGSTIITEVLCYGANTGSIDLSVTGGTTPYRYIWSSGQQTQDIINLPAGIYEVTIIDANNCRVVQSLSVAQPNAPISVSTSVSNVLCFGGATGSVTVSSSGGTGPYIVRWSTGEETPTRTNLSAGIYMGQVIDANGCSSAFTVRINEPGILSVNINSTENLCAGNNTASADALVTGGTAPYSYAWSNGETTSGISNLLAGSYSVTVTDANNCVSSSATLIITDPAPIAISISQTDINCYGNNSGAISISVTGGSGSYFYEWSNGSTAQNISSLAAGTYSVTVFDTNGCTKLSGVITLIQPAAPLLLTAIKQNVNCYNGSDGSISLTASGGTAAYTFLWADGNTSPNRTGLAYGLYSVVVTDASGCTYPLNVQIYQPNPLVVSFNKSDASCFGESTGFIQLNVSGGSPSYTYSWKKDASAITNPDLNALSAGVYEVTVTDSKNCNSVITTITIGQPAAALSIILTKVKDVSCNGASDGELSINTLGGTAAYSYTWTKNGIAIVEPASNSLSAGTYTVTVTDINGCSNTSASLIISEPAVLVASASSGQIVCNGNTTTVTASAVGGTASYLYRIDGGVYQSSALFSGISAGAHTITAKDQNGCTASYTFVIQEPEILQLSITTIPILCNGVEGATSIVVGILGGTAPYNVDRTLISGTTYLITVTDANGCIKSENVDITEPSPMVVEVSQKNISCVGVFDGEISLIVTGGSPAYSYSLDGVDFSNTTGLFQNLPSGHYTVTVKDINDCILPITVTITSPPTNLAVTINPVVPITCFGGTTSATAIASGGTEGAGYSYSWDTSPVQTSATITGLTAGNYNVTVTDANGCVVSKLVTINQPDQIILISKAVTAPINCFGETATVTLNATGGSAPLFYTFNGITNNTGIFNNVLAGTAKPFSITDINNCTPLTGTIDVSEPALLLAILMDQTAVSCFGDGAGSVSIAGANGTAPYSYSIDGTTFQASGTFTALPAGSYTFTVKDANGCTVTQNVSIAGPTAALASSVATQTPVVCFGDGSGSVTLA